jgi:hypothetical protein
MSLCLYINQLFAPTRIHDCNYAHGVADLIKWLHACLDGTFYELLANVLGMPCGTVAERRGVKRRWCYLTCQAEGPGPFEDEFTRVFELTMEGSP